MRIIFLAISLTVLAASPAYSSCIGWGCIVEGASQGLDDIEDRRAGRYDELRRRQEQQEYDRQMDEHRRLQRQQQEEQLRLMREQNDMMRYQILQQSE